MSDSAHPYDSQADARLHPGARPEAYEPPPEAPTNHDGSFADMVERLFRQFETRLSLPDIVTVVRQSKEQLRGAPRGALPELTERLAGERLARMVEGTEMPPSWNPPVGAVSTTARFPPPPNAGGAAPQPAGASAFEEAPHPD
jgi:hypothetical protein